MAQIGASEVGQSQVGEAQATTAIDSESPFACPRREPSFGRTSDDFLKCLVLDNVELG